MTAKMLDWNDLQYILALDEGKTIKRAAELLNTNPTTVSRHLKALSEERGEVLFTRDKDGICLLTSEGKQYRELAKDFRSRLLELDVQETEEKEHAVVTVTSLEYLLTNLLAPAIDKGLASYPDTRINLIGSDRRLSLAYGEADLALRFGRPSEGQLIASKIAEVEFFIWRPLELNAKEWIGLEDELDWTPEMRHGLAYFKKPPAIRVSSFTAARNAGLALGYAFVAPVAVVLPRWDQVETIDADPVRREVWSIIHETQRHSQRLAAVRAWAKEAVQDGMNNIDHQKLKLAKQPPEEQGTIRQ